MEGNNLEPQKRYILDNIDGGGPFSFLTQAFVEYNGQETVLENHRKAYVPGDDISDLPDNLKAAVSALWTPEVISAWQDAHPPVQPGAEQPVDETGGGED